MIISEEMDKRIVELYKEGVDVKVIANTCECGKGTMYKVLDANGIPRRQNKGHFSRRVCNNCGGKLPTDAKYCPQCGKFIMDKKQVALNHVRGLRDMIQYLPRNNRQSYIDKIDAVENYIRLHGLR